MALQVREHIMAVRLRCARNTACKNERNHVDEVFGKKNSQRRFWCRRGYVDLARARGFWVLEWVRDRCRGVQPDPKRKRFGIRFVCASNAAWASKRKWMWRRKQNTFFSICKSSVSTPCAFSEASPALLSFLACFSTPFLRATKTSARRATACRNKTNRTKTT